MRTSRCSACEIFYNHCWATLTVLTGSQRPDTKVRRGGVVDSFDYNKTTNAQNSLSTIKLIEIKVHLFLVVNICVDFCAIVPVECISEIFF